MRPYLIAAFLTVSACYNNPSNDLTAASTGAVAGTVSSNLGPLAGVTVTAHPEFGSDQTAVTNGNGQYTIENIPFGNGSVSVSGLPQGCLGGGSGYSMPTSPTTVTVNISVPCGITTGSVSGTITSTQGGAIVGATVTITPTGRPPLTPVTTNLNGDYGNDSVPSSPSTGTVTVSGLPTGCAAPAPAAYSGVAPLSGVTVNFIINCQTTTTTTGLWVNGQYLFTAAQLAQSGSPIPSDSCPGANSSISGGVGPEAFDANGNLWTARPNTSTLIMWTAQQLADACSPATPAITVQFATSASSISAMAFDPHGTLWLSVGYPSQGIFGISATQLGASSTSAITPTHIILPSGATTTVDALQTPVGLAFDASGNLWVGNSVSVIEYTPAQLASSGAAPTPTHYLSDSADIANVSVPYAGPITYGYLAFDARGNLWVSISASYSSLVGDTGNVTVPSDTVVEYTASQLANLASSPTPTPAMSLSESTAQSLNGVLFGAIAFDASGNLWLGTTSAMMRYPAANIAPGANGLSDVTITSPAGTTGYGASLAFNPTPAGLPINGARVATHIVQAKRAKQRYR